MKLFIIILIIIAFLGLGGAGYFFWQNQALESKTAKLKDEKSNVEKEFAVFKVTDFAKENEILTLKLKAAEKDVSQRDEKIATIQKDLAGAQSRIAMLEVNLKKIKSYTAILVAFNHWQYDGSPYHILDRDTSKIDAAIATLGDSEISQLWNGIKPKFAAAKATGAFLYEQVIILVTSRIGTILFNSEN